MSPLFRHPKVFRMAINLWPPYWGTGIRIVDVEPNWRRLEVHLRDRIYNRNAFGTHFGGSLYAMCDPYYALLLIPLLGPDYIIWDKAASIEFVKPGRGTVKAVFTWNDDQLLEIQRQTVNGNKCEPQRELNVFDEVGDVVARVSKTLYVRRRSPGPASRIPEDA